MERDERQPTLDQIAAKLKDLIDGRITRQEISSWASDFVEIFDNVDRTRLDRVALEAIHDLTAADLQVSFPPNEIVYFHAEDEFKDWLMNLHAGRKLTSCTHGDESK